MNRHQRHHHHHHRAWLIFSVILGVAALLWLAFIWFAP